jgi:hypothetical protein
MTRRRRIPADAPLSDSPERSVGLALPVPISDRVDALVALTEETGDRTNRKELIASLILAAPANGEELARALRRFRQATVGDARLELDSTAHVFQVPPPRPGPRPRRNR